MPFNVIDPIIIDGKTQVASDVVQEIEWDDTTTWLEGDQVQRNDKLWQALVDNTDSKPTMKNTDWEWIGLPAYLRPFDRQIGVDQPRVTETVAAGVLSIQFDIKIVERATTVALVAMQADEIEFEYLPNELSEPGSEGTGPTGPIAIPDVADYAPSFFDWGETPVEKSDIWQGSDFNLQPGSTLRVILRRVPFVPDVENQIVSIGGIVLGRLLEYDAPLVDGSASELVQRSVTEGDGLVVTVTPRLPGVIGKMKFLNDADTIYHMRNTMARLSGIITLFDAGPDHPEARFYGYAERVSVARVGDHPTLDLEINTI